MPFVTQSKTNWKYLLIVFILAVIVGGGILWWIWENKEISYPYQYSCKSDSDCHFVCGWGCLSIYDLVGPRSNIVCEYDPCNSCRCLSGKCVSWSDTFIEAQHTKDINLCEEITNLGCKNQCLNYFTQNQVTITTDKTEYEQGEIIKITVKNNLDKSIWDFGNCGGKRWWGVQKFENNSWEDVLFSKPDIIEEEIGGYRAYKQTCDFIVCEKEENSELKPNTEINDEWSLTATCEWPLQPIGVPKTNPKNIEEGTYRVFITYGLAKDFNSSEAEIIYSNEFTIKEKNVITKNCNLYEIPMTGEEIEKCTCPEGYEKGYRLMGAFCATNSQKPCSTQKDCPQGESCISHDGVNWFCTGLIQGCLFTNPEKPNEQICID